jgi:hypothetical protein
MLKLHYLVCVARENVTYCDTELEGEIGRCKQPLNIHNKLVN